MPVEAGGDGGHGAVPVLGAARVAWPLGRGLSTAPASCSRRREVAERQPGAPGTAELGARLSVRLGTGCASATATARLHRLGQSLRRPEAPPLPSEALQHPRAGSGRAEAWEAALPPGG